MTRLTNRPRWLRMTVGRLMIVVVLAALILNSLMVLKRRRDRFHAIAAEQWAAIQIGYFNNPTRTQDQEAPGYHFAMAAKYKAAAERPWLPLATDPPEPTTVKAFRLANEAVKQRYPGFDMTVYSIQISTMQFDRGPGKDPNVYSIVRYRHQDNRSGLNVTLRDPIEVHVHNDGPPPSP